MREVLYWINLIIILHLSISKLHVFNVNLDMDKDFMFDLACFAVFCCIAHIILLQ